MRRSLYKYFSRQQWAEAFLDGELFFNSLSYFRDYEDQNVRGDHDEGVSTYRPPNGLVGYNHTQRRPFVLPKHAFNSTANQDEIFVLCTSQVLSEELRIRFAAVACVEILNIGTLCNRIRAKLPRGATFFNRRVLYYDPSEPPMERWALPDKIATSKIDRYAWQCEYRFVVSVTDALSFENVSLTLTADTVSRSESIKAHPTYTLNVGDLRRICRFIEFE